MKSLYKWENSSQWIKAYALAKRSEAKFNAISFHLMQFAFGFIIHESLSGFWFDNEVYKNKHLKLFLIFMTIYKQFKKENGNNLSEEK